ncbi:MULTISPECIES: DUF979 domain-containing protein [unclassified Granulicatella]|uniref:DUF979 domain-containing protein n=1 Tax=unclassified Granulicatella TaxID=2630493 RepID=UPI0010732672|nr:MULTISPECIES: DUF979 domain-containing protein [unclassified Granulicatella]MBF0780204.1 DUF979 domain-containing protein [Granulicatella sp. 19428wC4_WM01]TFU95697.1 DUF979 domain-containing protein [Granulicatella sp. WM01]
MNEASADILEIICFIIGCQLLHTAYTVIRDTTNSARFGTTLFWSLLGIVFIFGKFLPPIVTGIIVVIISVLTLFKQVKIGTLPQVNEQEAEENAKRIGSAIFVPVIALAVFSLIIPLFYNKLGVVAIGIAAIISTLIGLTIVDRSPRILAKENTRMVQQISTSSILPQLLAALGAVFTVSGVGTVISNLISGVVPEGNRLFGVIAYVLGMVLFTVIMGNAFAAFTVITVGVGVPFVFALGANPVVAGALAMTAGYCGTLLTPMAANFNAVPVALMDLKDKNAVIKAQAPVAIVLIIVHIILMYLLAF